MFLLTTKYLNLYPFIRKFHLHQDIVFNITESKINNNNKPNLQPLLLLLHIILLKFLLKNLFSLNNRATFPLRAGGTHFCTLNYQWINSN